MAVFRIAFGIVATLIAVRYVRHGWVGTLLVDPSVHFSYPGLAWIRPWPEPMMTVHVAAMGVAGFAVALGWKHRLAAAVFLALFAWVELIDRTLYVNHYYWIALTAGLLIVIPASATWSVDARSRGSRRVPLAVVWLLRFQVGMVYAFAGLAKLNGDWMLHGEPLATWLGARTDLPIAGPLLGFGIVALALSWAGALFDLTIVGWLSWDRTRPYAYGALAGFHLVTWLLFPSIGLFPLVMTAGALVFFPPDWPDGLMARVASWTAPRGVGRDNLDATELPATSLPRPARWAVATYVVAMVAIPMTSLAHTDTLWHGDGYQFSWRVMLSERAATADFRVVDPATGSQWIVDGPSGLTTRQSTVMASDPVLLVQAAAMVEAELARPNQDLAVFADAFVAFNGRPHQRFIDPSIDLTAPIAEPLRNLVLPLEE